MPQPTECRECCNEVTGRVCAECGTAVPRKRAPRSTYRRESDVDREIGRESRETGIAWRTLRAGSR